MDSNVPQRLWHQFGRLCNKVDSAIFEVLTAYSRMLHCVAEFLTIRSFAASETTCPATQHYTPDDLKL